MKTTIAICVVGCLLAACGCAPRSRGVPPTGVPPTAATPLAPGAKLLRFSATMHSRSPELTFRFAGTVERQKTARQEYEYVLRSTVVVEKDGRPFPRSGVHLTRAVLTASAAATGRSPGRRSLGEDTRRIDVTLDKRGERIALPEIRLALPISIVAKSDRVTVDLTDGHFQVQVIPNLKGRKAFD